MILSPFQLETASSPTRHSNAQKKVEFVSCASLTSNTDRNFYTYTKRNMLSQYALQAQSQENTVTRQRRLTSK